MGIRTHAIEWACQVVCDGDHPHKQDEAIRKAAVMDWPIDDKDAAKAAAIKIGWSINGFGMAYCPACTKARADAKAAKVAAESAAKAAARRERAEAKLGKTGLF